MSEQPGRAGPDKPSNPNATRDHLANERTFLAWVRSCIAIVGLGFVVARFGLLIRELSGRASHGASFPLSTGIGVALVVCGAVLVILATLRYRGTERAIEQNDYRPSSALLLLLSGGFVVVTALLAAYLLVTA